MPRHAIQVVDETKDEGTVQTESTDLPNAILVVRRIVRALANEEGDFDVRIVVSRAGGRDVEG